MGGPSSAGVATGSGTIEVTGSANVEGTPDTLTLQMAVVTTQSSAAAALTRSNREMRRLQAVLTAAGVASADLATSGLNVSPTYDQASKVNGYQAEDDLTATLHDIAKSGAVIDAAENSVGNDAQINSIAFSLSNTGALQARARAEAMANARAQAESFARGGDETLGSIVKISPVQQSIPSPEPFNASAGAVKAVPVPIKPGRTQVSVQVDVIYRLVG